MGWTRRWLGVLHITFILVWVGCNKNQPDPVPKNAVAGNLCTEDRQFSVITGSDGAARVFMPDPIASSGDLALSPTASHLDSFVAPVALSNLTGAGLLKGKYVEVMSGLQCSDKFIFHAFETKNQFSYSQKDARFQEAMAYYFGDRYQASLDQTGYLSSSGSTLILAHCEQDDNSFFIRSIAESGKRLEAVCLGDSVLTPGAFYGDDGIVTIHELQHASTVNNYSPLIELNQLWYDEAGALNEGVSDFMALAFADAESPATAGKVDPRVFSRWALGTFDPKASHVRGAHKCPGYDSHFPNCNRFPAFEVPKSATETSNSISYVYPDGLGWPYPNNYKGHYSAYEAFLTYPSQEEIHNVGILLTGALWDAYEAVKQNHPENPVQARKMMYQAVLEAIRNLPQPNSSTNRTPVNFIGFASTLVQGIEKMESFSAPDRKAVKEALKARGLYEMPTIDSPNWMEVGSGTSVAISRTETPGVFIQDDPETVKRWLQKIYDRQNGAPPPVPQDLSTGLNRKLDPGELALIWFDIENNSEITAGGVLVSVSVNDPDVQILDASVNIGYLPLSGENKSQIMYGKINGTSIVKTLNSPGAVNPIPTGNSYFKTNPFFNRTYRNAIWVMVNPQATHGKVVQFQVEATPSNGVTSIQYFPVTIH